MDQEELILVIGGGAAGFFGAIQCAEHAKGSRVLLVEKGAEFLQKVRISGGGRCNVTHYCFEPREFCQNYPRGAKELLGPFHRFQARDTVEWFAGRGIKLKVEKDGRMFPETDRSATIIDCLMEAARKAGVELRTNCGVSSIGQNSDKKFTVETTGAEQLVVEKILVAQGGLRTPGMGAIVAGFGHTIESPVPSLFTFSVQQEWVRKLAGVSCPLVEVSGGGLRQKGALLLTHAGLSGPAVLRLSAWGARIFHGMEYRFPVKVDWFPETREEELRQMVDERRKQQGARSLGNSPFAPLSSRLWEGLLEYAEIDRAKRWSELNKATVQSLLKALKETEFQVNGKSLNKEEFVTCGGVRLSEVNFKTMESRICPGLYFAGEVLDIDGVTGGFNFQAAWTTSWIAGRAMAGLG
jgi:predicted Rossmann fold flavoprotein